MLKNTNTALSLIFVGDLSPSCIYSQNIETLVKTLTDIRLKIPSNTIFFFNLECSIFDGHNGTFTEASLQALEALVALKPAIANLSNNHHFDSDISGSERITELLDRIGIPFVGLYSDDSKNNYDILNVNETKIGILSRIALGTNPKSFGSKSRKILPIEYDEIYSTCRSLIEQTDLTIACLHWGAEYYLIPSPKQKILVDNLSKLGVDVIWGHHAHVLQPRVFCGNTLALYNLGNFIFGESLPGRWSASSQKSALVFYQKLHGNITAWEMNIKAGISGNEIFDNQINQKKVILASKVSYPYILNLFVWFLYRIYMELLYFGFKYLKRKFISPRNSCASNHVYMFDEQQSSSKSFKTVITERLRRILSLWEDE
jgi:hypothetical protein